MRIYDIINLIKGQFVTTPSEIYKNKEYEKAFACDLMSDCLAYVNENCLLITGLTHPQALRTAEMLDIDCIIFARGKKINQDMLDLAKQNNMILITTYYTVYEICGILYKNGLEGLKI